MNWLFIHHRFPGQYVHIVRALVANGHSIVGIGREHVERIDGVRQFQYALTEPDSTAHDYVRDFDIAVRNGLAVAQTADRLKREGFVPDLVVGHSGWGETPFVKEVWPDVPLLSYFEFFYRAAGSDIDFDPEFAAGAESGLRLRALNAINLLGLEAADWGHTPTRWQRDQYPPRHRPRISVIHEGVDTDRVRPDPGATLRLPNGRYLRRGDEVLTYVARDLEPYRGFHVFMRALPRILRKRPDAQVVIVGGDGVSYGTRPASAACWRQQLLDELEGQLDLRRVHFLGKLPYETYLTVLQVSTAHVYLTYPFILSWSLLEAMAAGCLVIGSRTPPLEEVVRDGVNGQLVSFFDIEALAERVTEALRAPELHRTIRAAARETVMRAYDLRRVCLPAYFSLFQGLLGKRVA